MQNPLLLPDWNMCAELIDPQGGLISRCAKFADQYPWEKKSEVAFFRGSDLDI